MILDRNALLWRLVAKGARCIVALGGHGTESPFYCVHSIGGEVGSLLPLANALGNNRAVYGIQVPRERLGAEFASSVSAIADYYVDILAAFQPEGSFLLGGWSTGSVIALEMAQKFQQRGRNVETLVVLDGILYNTGAEIGRWNPLYYWRLAENLPRWIAGNVLEGWGLRGIAKRLSRELKLVAASIGQRGRATSTGSTADAFVDMAGWPPEQADFARAMCIAHEEYCPKPYRGRVLVFAAKTQPLFHLLQVEAAWSKIAADIEVVHVDGTHLSMVREPRVRRLASLIQNGLSTAIYRSSEMAEPQNNCQDADGSLATISE